MKRKELLKKVLHARSVFAKNDPVLLDVRAWLTVKAVICVAFGWYTIDNNYWQNPEYDDTKLEMVATWDFSHEYLGNQTWTELAVAKGWNKWHCWIYSNGT